ncbi:uncharacterized protein LOC108094180 [Drosophila ficusphila]|uniref:uncharacterized protein LOC108094180 n=1 Tax=Drosophila ficusphila TaxID=30025 RepID=UPI0007E86B79|nr:uncharacterized protein LOC108094180 [Drosophila ficusphila]
MCEVQKLLDGLCQTFDNHKKLRSVEMVKILNRVRCCECGHQMRLAKAQQIKSEYQKSKSQGQTRKLLVACFGLLFLIYIYAIYEARRYNHKRAYGSSACGSTFFYSNNNCDVFY